MPETSERKRYRRGPAPGHLWSGVYDPTAPLPETAQAPPAPPRRPEPPTETLDDDAGRAPRRSSAGRRALAAGLVTGVLVTGGALGAASLLDDDGGASTERAAAPPPIAATPGNNAQSQVGKIYAAAGPAVASIQRGGGSGTGFLIEGDGTIVTNAHVVGDASSVQVQFGENGRTISARVVGKDTGTDLAVLKVEPGSVSGIKPLGFADSKGVKVGDLAVAIGNPLGLPQTATAGIISGLGREIQAPDGFQIDEVIQTDAPINPGNSGGPLLDQRGRVIGVNSQIATAGGAGGNIGIGFAVPSNTAREIVPQLKSGAQIERPWVGVSTSPSIGSAGAEVQETVPGSPAQRAGLTKGDVITKVDGKTVTKPEDVASAIENKKPGDRVSVEVRRAGQSSTFDVTLDERPAQTDTGR
jgi:putative serine protease PepD